MKKHDMLANGIIVLLVVLIALAIISFVFTISNSNIYLDLTNNGIKDFYNHYQSSVLFLGTAITLLTLWATLKRITQTQKQLEFIEKQIQSNFEQNRFINFYKHREEFIKTFIEHNFIKQISEAKGDDRQIILTNLYHSMYATTAHDFQLKINNDFEVATDNFVYEVEASRLNQNMADLAILDSSEIHKLRRKIPKLILDSVYPYSQKFQTEAKSQQNYLSSPIEDIKNQLETFEFIMIHDIFFSIKLLSLLLTFDDRNINKLERLTENLILYRGKLNLPISSYGEWLFR